MDFTTVVFFCNINVLLLMSAFCRSNSIIIMDYG